MHELEVIILLASCTSVLCLPVWYQTKREKFIREEAALRLGAGLLLNAKEAKVNERLMTLKRALVEKSLTTTHPYPPSIHFFKAKQDIDKSEIFQIIKKMPKGGVLHLHSGAMTSLNWLVKNLTYDPSLHSKYDETGTRKFHFGNESLGPEWRNVEEERKSYDNPETFDSKLISDFSIWTDDPAVHYPTINDVWAKFNKYFAAKRDLMVDKEHEVRSIMQGMEEFFQDGVQYLELRISYRNEKFFDMLLKEVEKFKRRHPSFIGVKIIIAMVRFLEQDKQLENIKSTMSLIKRYPDTVKGFDMVGQEDVGKSLLYYMDALLYPKERNNTPLPFFFHAGETDWSQGSDINLVDAVLLNTTRIGHGFAALKHPKVMDAVKQKKIAIELNPISNQVLGLVSDLRNHPGAILFAENAPVVISSDDPPVWNATPLSHDFYMAFMGLGGVEDDLRLLKQLAINSFTYSTMSNAEKEVAMSKWRTEWNAFIDDLIETDFGRNTSNHEKLYSPLIVLCMWLTRWFGCVKKQ